MDRKSVKIVKAEKVDADVIGRIHFEAWQQAYTNIFPTWYLKKDTSSKRKQEFLESYSNKDVFYYIIKDDVTNVGMVKLISNMDCYEISSFYILKEYRNKGYGKKVIECLTNIFGKAKISLWVLENNIRARHFYENSMFKNTGKTRSIYRGNYYMQFQYELLPEE